MITWRNGTVRGTRREWPGAVELDVSVDGAPAEGGPVRALAYPALTGRPRPGDRVLINTTALDLGLGTGGYALVVAVPDRLPPDPELAGHLVKARYSPLQATVLGADEQGSPYHDVLRDADDIDAMPVVVADLHSALPAVLAGIFTAERSPDDRLAAGGQQQLAEPRVVYVMQDGGALPAWFSRTCAVLREAGWLAATVTTGQSFGGDLETVTVHTGLLAARHVLGADIAVVAQGPGNLGTGTRWGFSGVAAGEAVNAAAALGGRPVASLRISDADPRMRHRGVSHHSLTAYGRVALARADVVVPAGWTRTSLTSWPQRRPAGTPAACCAKSLALLERVDDVDHEHQGVVALDAGLGCAGAAVALGRRDGEHHPAAHGLADQALVPARDDLLG
jgi:hypothetical protein